MRIDFLGLQAFIAIAERGSFLRAAAHLNLSQTALSHRMKKLEDDLGVRLLIRSTRVVTLTPDGEALLPKAKQALAGLAAEVEALREKALGQETRVALGCLPTIATSHLPHVLLDFEAAHPGVAVKIYDNSASEIAGLVRSGAAAFGIGIVTAAMWDLEMTPLRKEPFLLLCPQSHAFADKRAVSWGELEGVPLIRISPQAGNRALIDDALGSRREALNWRYEVQHVQTAVSMVQSGIGLTIVPKFAMERSAIPGLRLVTLRNPSITRTLVVFTKRGVPLSPVARDLLELVRARIAGRRSAPVAAP
ncbi:LysR family transcriptional regulator [Azorhizobium caulinodans]|uniref:LysR family transcriptional regulator n=1 Tax=Azorhizobium caulinodans TaxID=7 RepID=UPI002FBDB910